ncbi:hypothetical protein GQ55_9G162600 [Panicum hallii var. hallii]|uniref:Uncharacterized protein n=1 Tax=Panicum hallii var. hallii TaxID=1504633 RepID=A0A2T7C3T6_9POAL|nr:hypothetical protein GQ55_9G162600 [Panicum hallii var. hallii]
MLGPMYTLHGLNGPISFSMPLLSPTRHFYYLITHSFPGGHYSFAALDHLSSSSSLLHAAVVFWCRSHARSEPVC